MEEDGVDDNSDRYALPVSAREDSQTNPQLTRLIHVSIAHRLRDQPVVPTPALEDGWCPEVQSMLEARTREVAVLLRRIGTLEARIHELETPSPCNNNG